MHIIFPTSEPTLRRIVQLIQLMAAIRGRTTTVPTDCWRNMHSIIFHRRLAKEPPAKRARYERSYNPRIGRKSFVKQMFRTSPNPSQMLEHPTRPDFNTDMKPPGPPDGGTSSCKESQTTTKRINVLLSHPHANATQCSMKPRVERPPKSRDDAGDNPQFHPAKF